MDRKELDVSEEEDLLEELCPSWQKPNLGSRRSSFARTGSLDSDMDELQARLREEERELRATKAHERPAKKEAASLKKVLSASSFRIVLDMFRLLFDLSAMFLGGVSHASVVVCADPFACGQCRSLAAVGR